MWVTLTCTERRALRVQTPPLLALSGGAHHTVGVVYKAFIEKMGPEAKVLGAILSSLMLVRGGACAWSFISRSFILSSIKKKIK